MITRRKSTLFLVEQLIVIAVFALCAVACINIFASSYFMTQDSRAKADALILAQNCAEIFKAAGGDTDAVQSLLGGGEYTVEYDGPAGYYTLIIHYDAALRQTDSETDAVYLLTIKGSELRHSDESAYASCEITISAAGGGSILTIPAAAKSG